MIEAYLEAYKVIDELYTAEIKKLDAGPMTSEEEVIWAARLDAFREAEHAVLDLMYPQDNKKAADGGNRQQPE